MFCKDFCVYVEIDVFEVEDAIVGNIVVISKFTSKTCAKETADNTAIFFKQDYLKSQDHKILKF